MKLFPCIPRGGGITNSKVVTEKGKYSLDAVQNNPDVEGTLRNEIESASDRLNPLEEFYKIRSFDAGSGQNGYIKCATIKILRMYSNFVIMFEISTRRQVVSTQLYISFQNENILDPELNQFLYTGQKFTDIALCKSGASTWDLYVKKADINDSICIHRYNYNYLIHKFDISFPNVFAQSLPTDAIQTEHPSLYQ